MQIEKLEERANDFGYASAIDIFANVFKYFYRKTDKGSFINYEGATQWNKYKEIEQQTGITLIYFLDYRKLIFASRKINFIPNFAKEIEAKWFWIRIY